MPEEIEAELQRNAEGPESLNVPLLSRSRTWGIVAMTAVWIACLPVVAFLLRLEGGGLLGLLPSLIGWGSILGLFATGTLALRYVGTRLVIDGQGIWLTTRRTKQGLDWSDVIGYDKERGRITILAAGGKRFALPGNPWLDYLEDNFNVIRTLDRRIGPDGDRPLNIRPENPAVARVYDYFGQVPAVDMEPNVIYRHVHREVLSKRVQLQRQLAVISFASPLLFCALALFVADAPSWFGFLILPFLLMGIVTLADAWRVSQSIEDRYVIRQNRLFRIRRGQEEPMPEVRRPSRRKYLGQAKTRFGTSPLAQEVSMQFLEPDV